MNFRMRAHSTLPSYNDAQFTLIFCRRPQRRFHRLRHVGSGPVPQPLGALLQGGLLTGILVQVDHGGQGLGFVDFASAFPPSA